MRRKKSYYKLFSLVFIILFCCAFQTIVYSAINGAMTIKGDAYARVEADVRITGFRLASVNNATSSYEEFGKKHVVTEVNLSSTSSLKYYVEITNYGSVDVGIFDITGLPSGVNYSIKDYNLRDKICDDSRKCNSFIKKTYELTLTSTSSYTGSVQLNFDFRIFHKVTYTDITNNNYPTEVIDGGSLKITFKEDLKKIQFLSNGNEISYYDQILNGQLITINNIFDDIEVKKKELVAKLVNGYINEVGSEVCIEDECFYIISNDGTTVSMLAKYNLHVGNICTSYNQCTPLDNPTGKQDVSTIGYTFMTPFIGTTAFSSTNYWSSTVSSYPAYVYDSNSILYSYVENYKTYLSTLGVTPRETRLITHEELEGLGCYGINCYSAPDWVYSSSYWTSSATDYDFLYYVDTVQGYSFCPYYINDSYGVRPVIEIDVDEIDAAEIRPLVRVVSGDGTNTGDELCIGDECFFVMYSNDDTVTMLTKYNLYAGGTYNNDTRIWTAYGDEATGKQASKMRGFFDYITTYNGTTSFSTKEYWKNGTFPLSKYGSNYPAYVYDSNSILYSYVENYKTYLSTLAVTSIEARLITKEELDVLGCSRSSYSCSSAPSWVYTSSYWSGTAENSYGVYFVESNGSFYYANYPDNERYGVRPVIVIPRSLL